MTNPLRLDDGSMEADPTWRHHTSPLEERSHLLLVYFFIGYFSIFRIQFYPHKVLILIPCLRTGCPDSGEGVKNNAWAKSSIAATVRVPFRYLRLPRMITFFVTLPKSGESSCNCEVRSIIRWRCNNAVDTFIRKLL